MISFSCPRCKAFLTVDDRQAGSNFACAGCGQLMVVPAAERPSSVPAGSSIAPLPPTPVPARPAPPVRKAPASAGDVRVVNGRQLVFWPCAHCRLGLNTPYENVGLSIQCPGCQESVTVPDPIASYGRQGRPAEAAVDDGGRDYRLPRRRKSTAALFVALALTVLVIVGGVVGLLIWQPWANRGLSADQLRYLPDNSQIVASIDVQAILKSEVYRKVDQAFRKRGGKGLGDYESDIKAMIGMGWSDLEGVMLGGRVSDNQGIVVVKTKTDVNARDILNRLGQAARFDEITVDGFKIFKYKETFPAKNPSFCVVEPKLVVLSVDHDTLRAVLARKRGPILAPDLQAVMQQTDFSKSIAIAMGKLPSKLGNGGPGVQLGDLAAKLDGIMLEIGLGGAIDIKLSILCVDSKTAKDLNDMCSNVKALAGNVNKRAVPPELQKILDAIQFSNSGTRFSATASLDPDAIIDLAQKGLDAYLFGRVPAGPRK
jgi:hypothetical protein